MVLPGVSPAGGRTSLSELAEVCPCNSVFGLGMGAGGPASTGVPTCPVLRASGGGSEQPGERRAWNEQRDCPFVETLLGGSQPFSWQFLPRPCSSSKSSS